MLARSIACAVLIGFFTTGAGAQDVVYHALTPAQLEKVLNNAGISFQKHGDTKPNTYSYDYPAKQFNVRLYIQGGQHLMLDTLFAPIPLEKANEWNLGGRYSRAGLGKDEKEGSFTVVEARLNLAGGVTQSAIHEFLRVFVEELEHYQTFVCAASPRQEPPKEEVTVAEVSTGLLEKTLTDMNIKFTKVPLAKDSYKYEYQTKEAKIALSNWGKDMMLEAKFGKIPLEKVNQYNLERKFIRAVAYENKSGSFTGLEANLSFTGGISIGILRNYIAVFEEDAHEFAEYVKKANGP